MTTPKILAFAGSLRKDSWNKKLVQIAAGGAKQAGAEVTYIDLADFPMPVFDEDLEKNDGMPDTAREFKQHLVAHDALLIASPEYNSSISAALKNAIDWASRAEEGEVPLAAFNGKVAAIMSCSPGGLGGLRGLVHLRAILENINMIVIPDQRAVGGIHKVLDANGQLTDEKQQVAVQHIGAKLAEVAGKLKYDELQGATA